MRPSLTPRGRGLVSAGVSVLACGLLLGQQDLNRLAVFVLVLPVASLIVHLVRPVALSVERTVSHRRVVAGDDADVRLRLRNDGRSTVGALQVEESIPLELGYSPHYTIGSIRAGSASTVTYRMRCAARGRWRLGPLRVTFLDPLGLVEWRRTLPETRDIVVVPRIHPLTGSPVGGATTGLGETSTGLTAAAGGHDMSVREYRQGDDLRRVHWRSTARRGELMVRTDEQPLHQHTTVLLDSRWAAHRGEGAASSFEWVASAAASMCVHLPGTGHRVSLVVSADNGSVVTDDCQEQLDQLATLPLSSQASLAVDGVDEHHAGQLVALLGEPDDDLTELIAAGRTARGRAAALMAVELFDPRTDAARARVRREQAAARLRAAGWRVVEVLPDARVPDVWSALVGRDGVEVAAGA